MEMILNTSEDVIYYDFGDQYGRFDSFQFANWVQIVINNFELSSHWYCNTFNQGFEMPEVFQHLIWLFWTTSYYQACLFIQNK